MLGPFATASRLTPIHQVSLTVLSRAACASMSTTTATTTTTTTTRDRGDRYVPMEWAQLTSGLYSCQIPPTYRASLRLHDGRTSPQVGGLIDIQYIVVFNGWTGVDMSTVR